tara:strand:+ start:2318 stop:2863 length:546 start_codon:yes stop_codon:yes gene_type:complete
MKIADHLEKFERLDVARQSLDQAEDSELWFWTTITAAMQAMNAGLHAVGCTEERDDFPTQIMGVYERLSEDEKSFERHALPPGDLHLGLAPLNPDSPEFIQMPPLNPPGNVSLGIPQLHRPLPDELTAACKTVEVIEEVRHPSIRGTAPLTPELIRACDQAYDELVGIIRSLVEETEEDAS